MATSASGSGSASPSPTHLSRRLQQLSQSSTPTTALFYARLYHSFFPPRQEEHESLHTLALCFLQSGEPYSALHLVRDSAGVDEPDDAGRYRPFAHGLTGSGGKSAPCYGCAMIVARCCEKLGRFSEGQAVLSRALKRCTPTNLTIPSPASTSASAHLLLASLSHKGKAPEAAVDNYVRALQDDPWLWEAFTGLCDIGAAPSLESIFPDPPALSRASSARTSRPPTLSPNPMPRSSASEVPGLLPSRKTTAYGNGNGGGGGGFFTPDVGVGAGLKLGMMGNASSWDTPSAMGDTTFQTTHEQSSHPTSRRPLPNLLSTFMPSASHLLPASLRSSNASTPTNDLRPPKPPAMKRPRGKDGAKKTAEAPAAQLNGLNLPLARELRPNGHDRDLKSVELNGSNGNAELEGPVRRSSRLKGSSTKPAPPKVTRPRNARSRSVTSSASGATVDISSSPSLDSQLQTSADDWLRDVVRKCARAYRYLGLYQCQEAMRELDGLPYEVKTSAWSLDILARSFYEMANYVVARRAFASLLELEPYRLQSMEQYSTLLWHISDPPALSHLSQSLMSVNRESPQPWIAAGNCFSLQKDHDEAMRCFRRATQLDPGCAYAWTLCGYEAMEMEEYERAIAFYRTAIRNDSRHYNAWYGMGLVYMKTGKTRYAEHHFRRAVDINPTNAVLLCCVGMVLEQSDDIVQAIHFYERAVAYAPNSPMVQFKRIRVLVALQRFDEAIALLEPLSREAPDEANIFFLLGKCYLRRDRRGEATVAFTTARELQPKLEGHIKATLEANGEEEEEEED